MTHPFKTMFFATAALLLTCLAPSAFAAVPPFPAVGNPSDTSANNGANLAAAIRAVYKSGAKGVTINPGRYTLAQPSSTDTTQDSNLKLDGITRSL